MLCTAANRTVSSRYQCARLLTYWLTCCSISDVYSLCTACCYHYIQAAPVRGLSFMRSHRDLGISSAGNGNGTATRSPSSSPLRGSQAQAPADSLRCVVVYSVCSDQLVQIMAATATATATATAAATTVAVMQHCCSLTCSCCWCLVSLSQWCFFLIIFTGQCALLCLKPA
jgi:hypothetical protein